MARVEGLRAALLARSAGERFQIVDEGADAVVVAVQLRVRALDQEILVGGVGAAPVGETEVAGGQLERCAGEDVTRIRAGVARPERRFAPSRCGVRRPRA